MNFVRRFTTLLTGCAVLIVPQVANACSACMGDPNTNIAKGANAAIFLMLGLLGGMFALFAAFAICLYRRAKAPMPPHAELGDGLEPQAEGTPI
jgi:hypothetical protein